MLTPCMKISQLEGELSSVKTKLLKETQHSGDLSYQLTSCHGDLKQLQVKVSSLEEERDVLANREAELK